MQSFPPPGHPFDVPSTSDIPDRATLDALLFDYTIYETAEGAIRIHGVRRSPPGSPTTTRFLAPRTEKIVARHPRRFLIYVLTHDLETTERALETYAEYGWARVVWIPSTTLLEGVMYHRILPERIEEWRHADYVGTISYRATEKLTTIHAFDEIMSRALTDKKSFVAFFHKPDDLLATAETCHPGFLEAWTCLCAKIDVRLDEATHVPSFYGNYWACTPYQMGRYINFFVDVRHAMDYDRELAAKLWKDARYITADNQHLRQTRETCMRIFGVPYYPLHPFICERLPCAWVVRENLDVSYVLEP